METKTTHQHVTELHGHNQEALSTFRHLEAEVEAHLPPAKRVKEALAAHRKALEAAVSASQLKSTELAPADGAASEGQWLSDPHC